MSTEAIGQNSGTVTRREVGVTICQDLSDILDDLDCAVFCDDVLHFLLEDQALVPMNAGKFLLRLLDDGKCVVQGNTDCLQGLNGTWQEAKMSLDESKIAIQVIVLMTSWPSRMLQVSPGWNPLITPLIAGKLSTKNMAPPSHASQRVKIGSSGRGRSGQSLWYLVRRRTDFTKTIFMLAISLLTFGKASVALLHTLYMKPSWVFCTFRTNSASKYLLLLIHTCHVYNSGDI